MQRFCSPIPYPARVRTVSCHQAKARPLVLPGRIARLDVRKTDSEPLALRCPTKPPTRATVLCRGAHPLSTVRGSPTVHLGDAATRRAVIAADDASVDLWGHGPFHRPDGPTAQTVSLCGCRPHLVPRHNAPRRCALRENPAALPTGRLLHDSVEVPLTLADEPVMEAVAQGHAATPFLGVPTPGCQPGRWWNRLEDPVLHCGVTGK
jgi:hypothetical protein